MKIYNYIFYKVSQFLSVFIEAPSFAAIIIMSWLFMFNIFSIAFYVSPNYKVPIFLNSYGSIIGGILLFGGHLLYFYWKNRYAKIYKKYRNESRHLSVWGSISVMLYVFLTIWIHFKYVIPDMGGKI